MDVVDPAQQNQIVAIAQFFGNRRQVDVSRARRLSPGDEIACIPHGNRAAALIGKGGGEPLRILPQLRGAVQVRTGEDIPMQHRGILAAPSVKLPHVHFRAPCRLDAAVTLSTVQGTFEQADRIGGNPPGLAWRRARQPQRQMELNRQRFNRTSLTSALLSHINPQRFNRARVIPKPRPARPHARRRPSPQYLQSIMKIEETSMFNYGDIVEIGPDALLIVGHSRDIETRVPNVANALMYKSGAVLVVIDNGATQSFREPSGRRGTEARPLRPGDADHHSRARRSCRQQCLGRFAGGPGHDLYV